MWCSYVRKKKTVPNSWVSFPFPQKYVYSPAGSVPPPSHLTSCTPTKSNWYCCSCNLNQWTCPMVISWTEAKMSLAYDNVKKQVTALRHFSVLHLFQLCSYLLWFSIRTVSLDILKKDKITCFFSFFEFLLMHITLLRSVVGWGTMLQSRRSLVDSRWGHWIFQLT
jgi:hypothetical protein